MLTLADKLRSNWISKISEFKEVDDSLTNLNWLYNTSPPPNNFKIDLAPIQPTISVKVTQSTPLPYAGSLYDQKVREEYKTKWTGKPPFSYADLICLAMKELGKPKVTLADIYSWLIDNFAYYRHTDSSWQNSVRHNLSLNKSFEKLSRDQGERGKGGFWRVHPKHIDFMESHLARCGRLAPPPAPPPPVPRSMIQEAGIESNNAASIISSYLYTNNHQQHSNSNQSFRNNNPNLITKIIKTIPHDGSIVSNHDTYQSPHTTSDLIYLGDNGKTGDPSFRPIYHGEMYPEYHHLMTTKHGQFQRGRRKSQQIFLRVCSVNDDFSNSPGITDELESLHDLDDEEDEGLAKTPTESSALSSENESKTVNTSKETDNEMNYSSRRARRPVGSYFKMAQGSYSSDEEGASNVLEMRTIRNHRNSRKRGGGVTEPVWPSRLEEANTKNQQRQLRVKKTFFQSHPQVNILRHSSSRKVQKQSPVEVQLRNYPQTTIVPRNVTISSDPEEDDLIKLSCLYSSSSTAAAATILPMDDFIGHQGINVCDDESPRKKIKSFENEEPDDVDNVPLWASVFLPEDFSKISDLDSISFPDNEEAIGGLFNQESTSTSSESSPDSALDMFPLYHSSITSDSQIVNAIDKSFPAMSSPSSNSANIKTNISADSGLEQIFDLESIVLDNNGNIESFLEPSSVSQLIITDSEVPIDELC